MNLWGAMILRAGLTWGIVGVLLAIVGSVLGPILPEVDGLALGTFAFLMAGVHYSAKARSDFIQSLVGGGITGILAALLLLGLRYVPVEGLPTPPGTPVDIFAALATGFISGGAGGMGFEVIDR